MKYRITVNFGPYHFATDCESVAVAFHHLEAVILSPMYPGTAEGKEEACAAYLLALADLTERREDHFENHVFKVEAIREGRRT